MPAARELDDGDDHPAAPGLADGASRAVGFLDLPGVAAEGVIAAVLAGFGQVDDDAVLTAYCTAVDVPTMTGLCEQHGLKLVHAVTHGTGTTFVLQ